MIKPLVIKIGGAILSDEAALTEFFITLSDNIKKRKRPLVIVHGGGQLVENVLSKMGIKSTKKNGLRVTPFSQIPQVVGALAGTANKLLLAKANQVGLLSVGLSLADGFSCKVRQIDKDLGAVGVSSANDPTLINLLLKNGFLPIISSIGVGDDGHLYNVNADQAAVSICDLINGDLLFLSDVDGVLDENRRVITQLNEQSARLLIEQKVITDGMIVKVNSALQAAKKIGAVRLLNWNDAESFSNVLAGKPGGTEIVCTH